MIAFEENLIALLESIEDCLTKRRILPCLMLLYSGIDVVASLERVSKIDSASHQVLTCEIGYGLSFCHEEAAEAVDR
jgi:hypothetical protein